MTEAVNSSCLYADGQATLVKGGDPGVPFFLTCSLSAQRHNENRGTHGHSDEALREPRSGEDSVLPLN